MKIFLTKVFMVKGVKAMSEIESINSAQDVNNLPPEPPPETPQNGQFQGANASPVQSPVESPLSNTKPEAGQPPNVRRAEPMAESPVEKKSQPARPAQSKTAKTTTE